jgi:hypothetical protein
MTSDIKRERKKSLLNVNMMSQLVSSIYTFAITGIWPKSSPYVTPWDGSSVQLMNIIGAKRQEGLASQKIILVISFLAGKKVENGNALCPGCPLARHVLHKVASKWRKVSTEKINSVTFLELNCSEYPEICRSRRIQQFPFIEIISPDTMNMTTIPFTPKYDSSIYGFDIFFDRHLPK